MTLHRVLGLPECRHHINTTGLSGELLDGRVIKSHENVVLLLITNSEFALGLLVLIGESFKLLDGLRLQDLDAEFDISLGVLVTRVNVSVVRKRGESLVQRLVHLLGVAFEEAATTANEQSVTSENSTVVSVFEEEANAILGVARRVEGLHLDVLANREGVAMSGSLVDLVAVFAADDGKRVALEDLCVSASVVMVVVSVDDVYQLDTAVFGFLEVRQDFRGIGRVNDDSLLGLVVSHEIGVVVATPLPHGNRLNMHFSCSNGGNEGG